QWAGWRWTGPPGTVLFPGRLYPSPSPRSGCPPHRQPRSQVRLPDGNLLRPLDYRQTRGPAARDCLPVPTRRHNPPCRAAGKGPAPARTRPALPAPFATDGRSTRSFQCILLPLEDRRFLARLRLPAGKVKALLQTSQHTAALAPVRREPTVEDHVSLPTFVSIARQN